MSARNVTDIELDSAHSAILNLVRKKKYEAAVALCKAHLERWPEANLHEAWHNLSYVQSAQGDTLGAIDSLSKAVSLAPDYPAHRDARARLALQSGKEGLAIEDCTALLRIEGQRRSIAFVSSARLIRSLAYMNSGSIEAAYQDLKDIDDSGSFYMGGVVYSKAQLLGEIEAKRRT